MINLYIFDNYSKTKNNGLNSYIEQLTKGIARSQNVNLHFFWFNSTEHKDFEIESENGITHFHLRKQVHFYKEDLSYEMKVIDFIAKKLNYTENNIIHFNWINHCPLAWYLKQKVSCRTVLTKHSIPWRDYSISNYRTFYQLDQSLKNNSATVLNQVLKREQINYDAIDHIITVTQFAKQSLIKIFSIPENKITVISNGLDPLEIKRGAKSDLRKKYSFNIHDKILLFAGNLDPRKGILELVEVFEQLTALENYDHLHLIIAGSGNQGEILKEYGKNSKNITITGSLDKNILYDFYQMADIGIVPSYIEQCSYTAIEMMFAGLPIIVTDVDGLKEMVPENCGLKVKVNYTKEKVVIDLNDFKSKILYYLQDRIRSVEFAKNAKINVLKNFTAEKMAEKTIDLYHKLIEEPTVEINKETVGLNLKKQTEGPLVSIILACYNGEKYLQKCLDSIFAQTYTNFELIIIDDSSTDKTVEIVKQNDDLRITLILNRNNEGAANSLNKGINLSKGKYIARIDQDDKMHSSRLSEQVHFLNENLDYGVVGSNCVAISHDDLPIYNIQSYVNNEDIKLGMLFKNQIVHPAVMIRSDIMKKNFYKEQYKHCDDYELWFRIMAQYKIYNLPNYLTFYRLHSHNTSRIHLRLQQQNTLELISEELEKLNIAHTVEELVIHAAISFGQGINYFQTPEKIEKLHSWLDKIFTCESLLEQHSESKLKEFKKHIIENYCGLN